MAVLPISRTVNVSLTINSAFAARTGFGVPLFLTTVEQAGKVDDTIRTKVYGSIEEVAADWATTTDAYKAANVAFAQNPRPLQIKIGYVDATVAVDAAGLKAELDEIWEYDKSYYWICVDSVLRDDAALAGLIEWVEARPLQAILDSNDINTEDSADTTCIAAANKGEVARTSVFYHTDAAIFPAFAFAAKLGTFNFDDANTRYTGKFKKLQTVSAINKNSAAVQAITGFTPQIGQAVATGHMANTYINIKGQNFVVEGSTLTPNLFIDQVHAGDWIIARTEERLLDLLLINNSIPYTNNGLEQLASVVREIMQIADRAGLIARDFRNPSTGEFEPNFEITVPDVFSVTESQRGSRIAPAIECRFRYAGSVHYAVVRYTMAL